ncbi:MAG: transketolase, partial [Mycoplasma sp.]|nr:transketolase [Mycoplasma sp.]
PLNPSSRNILFGVREFSMAAIANGIALHSQLIPFVSTFAVFSDYLKPALRLSALMKLRVIYILTHDSVFVGEDGPTHQPIEQLAMLRSIPGVNVFRPADEN